MKKTIAMGFFCLIGFLFLPNASHGQCDPPEIPYEQDNKYEAVVIYVDESECGEGAIFSYNFAGIFHNKLEENGYDAKFTPNEEVDFWDFTDTTIWEDGEDNVAETGTDWADAILFVTHGAVGNGEGASHFMMG